MKCLVCQNTFEQVHNGMKKYCCRRCLEIARQRRLYPVLAPKQCDRSLCGKWYQPKSKASKYCSYRCKNIAAVVKRRHKLKQRAVEYKGGKCQYCGYMQCIAALEFHHRDPGAKEFQVTNQTRSWGRVKFELDKCDIVCANCHREIHQGLINSCELW